MELLAQLHQINYFSLTFAGKQQSKCMIRGADSDPA